MLSEEVVEKLLPEVRQKFRQYATRICAVRRANGWASLHAGRIQSYAECFAPIIDALAMEWRRGGGSVPEDLDQSVLNWIEQKVFSSVYTPTDPWMPCELFTDQEFREGMLVMIRLKLHPPEPPFPRSSQITQENILLEAVERRSQTSSRKARTQFLLEDKILKNFRSHDRVAEDLGLDRSICPNTKGAPGLLPIPLTCPWMARTLFDSEDVQTAMYNAITRELGKASKMYVNPEPGNTVPHQLAGPVPRRHGFPANLGRHKAIANVVSRHAPNWPRDFRSWKWTDVLHAICLDLGQALGP